MMLPPDPEYIFFSDMESILCLTHRLSNGIESILAGTQSGHVHIWNIKTKRQISSFKSGEDSCISINIPQQEQEDDVVITQNKSGEISFWRDTDNQWSCVSRITTDFFGFCKAVLFKGVIFVPQKNGYFQTISVNTRDTLNRTRLINGDNLGDIMAFKIIVLNNENHMLVAYEGQKLILWFLNKSSEISSLQMTECPMALDFDVKRNKGIYGNPTDQIVVFSLGKNLELKVDKTVSLVNPGVASVQIRPDSKLVAVGCWDGKLRLYSWKTLTLLAALDVHSSTVQDVSFFRSVNINGKIKFLLLAGSKDKKISLWDIYN
ncbi:hypothetical protein RUM43_010989 [Polyplax serrata]|uniref:Guanine nucleotide-binding protein subunit beta-like protein 1 n=1 Tax=Polyplax serrata TaxID=468196 RepID=A0AAN8NL93_POLSC